MKGIMGYKESTGLGKVVDSEVTDKIPANVLTNIIVRPIIGALLYPIARLLIYVVSCTYTRNSTADNQKAFVSFILANPSIKKLFNETRAFGSRFAVSKISPPGQEKKTVLFAAHNFSDNIEKINEYMSYSDNNSKYLIGPMLHLLNVVMLPSSCVLTLPDLVLSGLITANNAASEIYYHKIILPVGRFLSQNLIKPVGDFLSKKVEEYKAQQIKKATANIQSPTVADFDRVMNIMLNKSVIVRKNDFTFNEDLVPFIARKLASERKLGIDYSNKPKIEISPVNGVMNKDVEREIGQVLYDSRIPHKITVKDNKIAITFDFYDITSQKQAESLLSQIISSNRLESSSNSPIIDPDRVLTLVQNYYDKLNEVWECETKITDQLSSGVEDVSSEIFAILESYKKLRKTGNGQKPNNVDAKKYPNLNRFIESSIDDSGVINLEVIKNEVAEIKGEEHQPIVIVVEAQGKNAGAGARARSSPEPTLSQPRAVTNAAQAKNASVSSKPIATEVRRASLGGGGRRPRAVTDASEFNTTSKSKRAG